MTAEAKKKISVIGLIAIFLTSFGYMVDMAIIPAAEAIFAQFYDSPQFVLDFILSGSQLFAVISTLLSTFLMRYVSKKYLLIGLFSILTIGSCLGAVVHDATYVAVMRGVAGLGAGGLLPVSAALLSELYRDDLKIRSRMVSGLSGMIALMGAIMAFVSGLLVVGGWTHAFDIYLAAIPMLVLIIIFVPKTPPEKTLEKQAVQAGELVKEKMPVGRLVALVGSMLFATLMFCTMSYTAALYIAETGLGDSVLAGVVNRALLPLQLPSPV